MASLSAIWSGGASLDDSCQGRVHSCVGCQLFPSSLLQPQGCAHSSQLSALSQNELFQPREALGACSGHGVAAQTDPAAPLQVPL